MSTNTVRLLYLNGTAKVHRPIDLSPTTTSYAPSRLLQLFQRYANDNHCHNNNVSDNKISTNTYLHSTR